MNRVESFLTDRLDSRWLFRGYAYIAFLFGLLLLLWGPMFFEVHIGTEQRAGTALPRIFGSILMAVGCMSAALAPVPDPEIRRRACGWFAVGHALVALVIALQHKLLGASVTARWPADLLAFAMFLFFYLWLYPEGQRRRETTLTSIFRNNNRPKSQLRNRYEEQIRLAAGQEERHRLARDLHDSVKQQLFVIQTSAATAQARLETDPNGVKEAIEQVRTASREAIGEMQAMLDQLQANPIENNGLVAAIRKQGEALGFRTGAQVDFEFGELPPSETFTPGTQDAILRLTQEALSNIARHARAKHVNVSLSAAAGNVILRIHDDGAGFEPGRTTPGMGLSNMRSRTSDFGGTFELESAPGQGATATFRLPYRAKTLSPRCELRYTLFWLSLFFILLFTFPSNALTYNGWLLAMATVETGRHLIGYINARGAEKSRA